METSHENLAADVARELAAQRVATPMQQIIHQHHSTTVINPPLPSPAILPTSLTEQATQTGQSIHEVFSNRFDQTATDTLPIQYFPQRQPISSLSSTEFPAQWQRPQPIVESAPLQKDKIKPVKAMPAKKPVGSGPPHRPSHGGYPSVQSNPPRPRQAIIDLPAPPLPPPPYPPPEYHPRPKPKLRPLPPPGRAIAPVRGAVTEREPTLTPASGVMQLNIPTSIPVNPGTQPRN